MFKLCLEFEGHNRNKVIEVTCSSTMDFPVYVGTKSETLSNDLKAYEQELFKTSAE